MVEYGLTALIALLALLAGHLWGRRAGYAAGSAEGRGAAPLELREQALSSGRCPVCATPTGPDSVHYLTKS